MTLSSLIFGWVSIEILKFAQAHSSDLFESTRRKVNIGDFLLSMMLVDGLCFSHPSYIEKQFLMHRTAESTGQGQMMQNTLNNVLKWAALSKALDTYLQTLSFHCQPSKKVSLFKIDCLFWFTRCAFSSYCSTPKLSFMILRYLLNSEWTLAMPGYFECFSSAETSIRADTFDALPEAHDIELKIKKKFLERTTLHNSDGFRTFWRKIHNMDFRIEQL